MKDYIEFYGCRVAIVHEGAVCPINDNNEVFLPHGALHDITVSYHGEDAAQYWLRINGKYIAESINKYGEAIELPLRLCKAANDVLDIHQNFHGESRRWKFIPTDGNGVKIEFTVAPAKLKQAEAPYKQQEVGNNRCVVMNSEEIKTHTIPVIGYKIEVDLNQACTALIVLKEKADPN